MVAKLKPFHGVRYNVQKLSLSDVMAPPYDVISPEEREELYRKSAYNVVRLELGKDEPGDNPASNRYTRAKTFLDKWLEEGVLVRDEKPCFYLYEQSFPVPGSGERKSRRALFTLLRLEEFGSGAVFPHEKTFPKPKEDRFNLLKATRTNLSPVFGLYEDASHRIEKILSAYFAKPPLAEGTDRENVRHRFWRVDDESAIRDITESFQDKKIVIADGHHRYETALNYCREKKKAGENGPAAEFVLISLVNIEDPGLLVLPTHRLVRPIPGFSKEKFVEALGTYFELRRSSRAAIRGELDRLSAADKGFGVCIGKDEVYLARLRGLDKISSLAPHNKSKNWAALEVSILSYVILEKVLGLKEDSFEDFMGYSKSEEEVFRKLDGGEFALAVLLRSIPVSDIQKVCEGKELLPHKSTYFYPKLGSGFVFYQHQ